MPHFAALVLTIWVCHCEGTTLTKQPEIATLRCVQLAMTPYLFLHPLQGFLDEADFLDQGFYSQSLAGYGDGQGKNNHQQQEDNTKIQGIDRQLNVHERRDEIQDLRENGQKHKAEAGENPCKGILELQLPGPDHVHDENEKT